MRPTRKWISAIAMVAVCSTVACEDLADPLATPDASRSGRSLSGVARTTPQAVGQRFIVTLAEREDPRAVAAAYGVTADHVYSHVLNGFAGTISEAARSGMLRDARIVSIDPDIEVQHQGDPVDQWGATWGLDRIDQRGATLDGRFRSTGTGEGVTVYVVDSGINYAHTEFEGRASYGYDTYGGDGSDCHGHGTHVAGTIGGKTYGVAKSVRLVSVKTLGCTGSGSVTLIMAGLDWVAANATGPSVVNLSIASPAYDPFDRAVERLSRAGIPVVVAAANYNRDACEYSPAREPSAITVGATTSADFRASFSNWGSCVDLFAPGSSILSADYLNPDGGATTKSGTSMSAPHVTGVVALYLAANPGASSDAVQAAIKASTTKGIVTSADTENNDLLFVDWTVAPPPAAASIELSGSASKQKWAKTIQLSWKGAEGSAVTIKLNGALLGTTGNTGSFTYETASKGRSSFDFEICEIGGKNRCSNVWSTSI